MAHCIVPEAEALLDREFPVLDKGFVRLVDYLGGDARIVQSARVSYGEGTRAVREDAALIDYLLRHDHTSPFEQVVLTFHVKLPIFVARQWIRHRTARVNEISGRYSIMKDEFYIPAPEDIALQSSDNKQGRMTESVPNELSGTTIESIRAGQLQAFAEYSSLIETGIARELARVVLPLSLYTEWYWQIDLHNLFRFLALRLDPHAQKEIRVYAEAILPIVRAVAPLATTSFERNIQGGLRFTKDEVEELRRRLAVARGQSSDAAQESLESLLSGKALERFEEKLLSGKVL